MSTARKKFKFAETLLDDEVDEVKQIDWSICVLCENQQISNEILVCPGLIKRSTDKNAGYESLATNILKMQELNALPMHTRIDNLKEENLDLCQTFIKNQAKWHKKCSLKFNSTEVSRAIRRKNKEIEATTSTARTSTVLIDCEERPKRTKSDEKFPKVCFFCEKPQCNEQILHSVTTKSLETKIRNCVSYIGDNILMAKLAEGDMVAREHKYHLRCLINIYNKCRPPATSPDSEIAYAIEGIAFSEILVYIEEARKNAEKNNYPVFKIPLLIERYVSRTKQLLNLHGNDTHKVNVHNTRFRDKILNHFGDMRAIKSGKEFLLVCDGSIGDSLRGFCETTYDNEAAAAIMVAKTIRKRALNTSKQFDGEFKENCQQESIDPLLVSLITTLLYGSESETEVKPSQPVLTICQLISFNMHREHRITSNVKYSFHNSKRESPLPIYLALKLHSLTRSRGIVDMMNGFGLSISYDQLRRISSSISDSVIERFNHEKVLCPPNLKMKLFTTAAYDNLDYNPTSTTSEESFHGTSISIFQHPEPEQTGIERCSQLLEKITPSRFTPQLPREYFSVAPSYLPNKKPLPVSLLNDSNIMIQESTIHDELIKEFQWLESSFLDLGKSNNSWSSFHSSKTKNCPQKSIISLMPLFYEDSKSVAMMKHALKLIKKTIFFLNPHQIPVVTMDQPLFALAKAIQWTWPDEYGEEKYFIVFGSLHVEQAFEKLLGKYLDNSGWTNMLTKSGVASSGIADSFIKVTSITKTRLAHQITVTALYQLMRDAYSKETESEVFDENLFEEWRLKQEETVPSFKYWSTCINLQLLLLMFVRAHRTANYDLYVNVLRKMIPWFFAMDSFNYARWLPIYLKDLLNLPTLHPEIQEAFEHGHFVVQKSNKVFSSIGLDQAHEQNNAVVKGDGGAVGLLTDPTALRRYLLAGPEIARLVVQFEERVSCKIKQEELGLHHEQTPFFQNMFSKKVNALRETIQNNWNPFIETSKEIFSLDNAAFSPECANNVMAIEVSGNEQYRLYVQKRIATNEVSIYDPISNNNFKLFKQPKGINKASLLVKTLKKDIDLFSKLFIICTQREIDIDQFFSYENHPFPPSISVQGTIRSGDKSVLLKIIEKYCCNNNENMETDEYFSDEIEYDNVDIFNPLFEPSEPSSPIILSDLVIASKTECLPNTPKIDIIIYDGPALVHILAPRTQTTFQDYSIEIFQNYIFSDVEKFCCKRVDIIWDTYCEASIKAQTRNHRGDGQRIKVRANNLLPKNWHQFLRNVDNKTELFSFLATDITQSITFKNIHVFSTNNVNVITNNSFRLNTLLPDICNHEEADSRIFVHVLNALLNGHQNICIRTVDTDVLVLAVSFYYDFVNRGLENMWIHFGSGKNFRIFPVHILAQNLSEEKSVALRGFHAFSGCDSTSFFAGRGKTIMWNKWNDFPEATKAFYYISFPQAKIPEDIYQILQRYLILCYCSTSDCCSVNDARKILFTTKNRTMENIPPTENVFKLHVLRSAYQSGHKWGQLLSNINLPDIENWGWSIFNNQYVPLWSTEPEVSHALREFVNCTCKTGCASNCSCRKNDLRCTLLCKNCNKNCKNI